MATLPKDFVAYCRNHFDDANELLESLNTHSPTSVRVNSRKGLSPNLEKVSWCDTGYYLPERPSFTSDPLFHAGAYYVQEASSMLISKVAELVDRDAPLKILDLCAAPGGKTTLLLDLFPNALVVANEIIPKRAKILAENVTKWGTKNCIVINATPEQLSQSKLVFDIILTDAPCSGEGMFRKDLNARDEWSTENVTICANRQQDIISTISNNLKEDGILIYSTCTFNSDENENNANYFIEELGMEELTISAPSSATRRSVGYQMYPHRAKGEGFYCAFLKQTNSSGKEVKKVKPNKSIRGYKGNVASLNIFQAQDLWVYDETIHLFNKDYLPALFLLQQSVRIIQFGHKLGKEVKRKFLPDGTLHTLPEAKSMFPMIEVSHVEAVDFLKKKDIKPSAELKDGWYFVAHNSTPIGLIKKIGNRSNNYFPKEWRIINDAIQANFSLKDV